LPTFVLPQTDHRKVSHVFHTPQAVAAELPSLLKGQTVKPSSGLGKNAESEKSQAPKAIVVGAGFSRSELGEMRELEGAKSVPWLYPDMTKMAGTGVRTLFGGDFMTSIVNRAKSSMQSHGLVEGKESEVKPEVWGF
jgi:hypothetical protein